MKIEWTEKCSLEINESVLRQMAKDKDRYAIPYGWNLVEHCLDEWMTEPDTRERIGFEEIVERITAIVEEYKNDTAESESC